MIKMLGLLTRKPHLTHAQFVDHWLNIGQIKSYVIEEKQIIPPPPAG